MAEGGQPEDEIHSELSSETGENIANLTSILKDLVTNLKEPRREINVTKITSQTFKPEKFQPSITDSPATWLSKFKSWIKVNNIDDLETIKHSFRLLMPDNDLAWFDNLTIRIREDIYDAFTEYFQAKQQHWIIEQSLWNKTMRTGENIEHYISDIQSCPYV